MPALLTRMSSRPCRSTIVAGQLLERRRVGDVERSPPRRARPPRRSPSTVASRVIAARGGDDQSRPARASRVGNRAADAARRAGHERDFAGQIEHHAIRPQRHRRRRREIVGAAEADAPCASRWILRTSPLSTVPGPTSTYVVTPSDARRRTTASQRTGDDTCATSASIARRARRASARRRRWRRPARADPAPRARAARAPAAPRPASSARSGTARSPAAASTRLAPQRLRALAGARDGVARARQSPPGRRRSGSPG